MSLYDWVKILGLAGGAMLLALVGQAIWFVLLCQWADQQTTGLGYFGRTRSERDRFKRTLSTLSAFATPLIWIMGRIVTVKMQAATFTFRGVAGPKDSCSADTYKAAADYEPSAEDVFIATQMRCGTTWMQHLVYQVLTRGTGDLVESGKSLYAVSPWIEARKSVSMEDSPLIGDEKPRRIIKTHLPASLCPYSGEARYIYVVRHPVSCFASTVDFIRSNLGPLELSLDSLEEWFCSDQMWWSPWPDHVLGWKDWADHRRNVLLIRFEDMKADLPAVVTMVTGFLGVSPLSPEELAEVVRKCSFDYMSRNSETFEMSVPTVLTSRMKAMVSGAANRYESVPDQMHARILEWARSRTTSLGTPLDGLYSDLVPEVDSQPAPAGGEA